MTKNSTAPDALARTLNAVIAAALGAFVLANYSPLVRLSSRPRTRKFKVVGC